MPTATQNPLASISAAAAAAAAGGDAPTSSSNSDRGGSRVDSPVEPPAPHKSASAATNATTNSGAAIEDLAPENLKQIFKSLDKRRRNLEKRRERLHEYNVKLEAGENLNKDQREAASHYEEVVGAIYFAKELADSFRKLAYDAIREEKHQAKISAQEKRACDLKRLRHVIGVNRVFRVLAQPQAKRDLLAGANGAPLVSEAELAAMEEVGAAVRLRGDDLLAAGDDEAWNLATDHLQALLDASVARKTSEDLTYADVSGVLERVLVSGYCDVILAAPVGVAEAVNDAGVDSEAEDSSLVGNSPEAGIEGRDKAKEEEERSMHVDHVVESEAPVPVFAHQRSRSHDEDDESVRRKSGDSTLLAQSKTNALQENSLPQKTKEDFPPAAMEQQQQQQPGAAKEAFSHSNPTKPSIQEPVAQEQDKDSYSFTLAPPRPFHQVMESVQGSINFLQDSFLDSDSPAIPAPISGAIPAAIPAAGPSPMIDDPAVMLVTGSKRPTGAVGSEAVTSPASQIGGGSGAGVGVGLAADHGARDPAGFSSRAPGAALESSSTHRPPGSSQLRHHNHFQSTNNSYHSKQSQESPFGRTSSPPLSSSASSTAAISGNLLPKGGMDSMLPVAAAGNSSLSRQNQKSGTQLHETLSFGVGSVIGGGGDGLDFTGSSLLTESPDKQTASQSSSVAVGSNGFSSSLSAADPPPPQPHAWPESPPQTNVYPTMFGPRAFEAKVEMGVGAFGTAAGSGVAPSSKSNGPLPNVAQPPQPSDGAAGRLAQQMNNLYADDDVSSKQSYHSNDHHSGGGYGGGGGGYRKPMNTAVGGHRGGGGRWGGYGGGGGGRGGYAARGGATIRGGYGGGRGRGSSTYMRNGARGGDPRGGDPRGGDPRGDPRGDMRGGNGFRQ